ncbi:MAG: ABC-type phosphate/phosphonate transport system, periplasmic component [Polaromonas sp.]|nr:ABC-type phosphate/phosphonate transport system, periplasmic component [Polaromonas sp.]
MTTSFLLARRHFLSVTTASLGLAATAGLQNAWAQAPAAAKKTPSPVAAGSWRLVINEAVTGETNSFLLLTRYRPLGDFLSHQLKGKAINVEPIVDIKRFMVLAQGAVKPELVFGKSVNQLAKLVRDHGYQPVVRRADPYKAAFIVVKDSPLKTLADANGKKIVMPDASAATSAVALAELRQQKVTPSAVTHAKFQEEVAQFIKSGFGQIGVVNPTIAKKWIEDGGRVLAETQPMVNWSLLAAPSVPAAVVRQLQDALLDDSAEAAAVLAAVGVKSWVKAEPAEYMTLLAYTKE